MSTRYLPAPPPFVGPYVDRCTRCLGRRVTGVRYRFAPALTGKPGTRPVVLLVDELCPTCGGCGRRRHTECDPEEHAGWDPTDDPDQLDENGLPISGCPSCGGRGWIAVLGFASGQFPLPHHLRVPCGCAEHQLVEAA